MDSENKQKVEHPSWAQLLKSALTVPGKLSAAFRSFHRYSLGNQLLAYEQLIARRIPIGPISTFLDWKAKGRYVKKGEKAIVLCMPILVNRKKKEGDNEDGEVQANGKIQIFVYKPHWFAYAQTEGDEVRADPIPGWDEVKALDSLQISKVAFSDLDGNMLGYARQREVAISPVCPRASTLFHELAHIVLGHCEKDGKMVDGVALTKNLVEAEAESVAMIMLETLGLPGADECRGYIQNWYHASDIPEKSAQRIFKAADKILKAGQ